MKKSLGRPSRRLKDVIKMDYILALNWSYFTQDRSVSRKPATNFQNDKLNYFAMG
jgi:hypothetical protein